ncbi:MAG TPA: hypothetical protein VI756_25770 [Blastocatellia bacterium]
MSTSFSTIGSIIGRLTAPVSQSAAQGIRWHLVTAGEDIVAIANHEYNLVSNNPDAWRAILEANHIENPFALDELIGTKIMIPPLPATTPAADTSTAPVLEPQGDPLGTDLAFPLALDGKGGIATVSDDAAVVCGLMAVIDSPRGSHIMEPWYGIPRLPFRSVSSLPALATLVQKAIINAETRVDPNTLNVQIGQSGLQSGQVPIQVNYTIVNQGTPQTLQRGYRALITG